MASTRDVIRDRILSLLADLRLTLAQSPFDFDAMPTGTIDACARVEMASSGTIGGLNFTEDRTDLVTVWIARKQAADPEAAYQQLLADVDAVTSAVVHDGAETSGEYAVLDGAALAVSHERGQEYAVARLDLPINYEVEL
jgi:hypothetical protein